MKIKRIIASILAVSILLSGVYFAMEKNDISFGSGVKAVLNRQDRIMAENISDLTGESTANIAKLRAESGSWNDVLDTLQSEEGYDKFMTDDELEELLDRESLDSQNVSEAKSLSEQIFYNLKEIAMSSRLDVSPPQVTTNNDISSEKDEAEEYKKLEPVYDKNLAVYLSLKLKNKFGSLQQVFDEYLYCLQVGADLRVCIASEKEYDNMMLEKSALLMRLDAITLQKISEFLILKMQQSKLTEKDEDPKSNETNNPLTSDVPSAATINDVVPKINDPRPKDPTAEIMDEIDKINQRWMY